jgi:hypothetical protein
MAKIDGAQGEIPGYLEHGNNEGMPLEAVKYNLAQEAKDIENYWGLLKLPRFFVISIDTLDQLFDQSPIDKVAIRVSNYMIPELIRITWHSFDGKIPVEDLSRTDVYYLILEAKYYFGVEKPNQILGLRNGANTMCIAARPGLNDKGDFAIYLSAVELKFPDNEGGIGNGSGSPGLKIPSTP